MAASSVQHDLQEVHQEGHPHQGQGRYIRQHSRRGGSDTLNKIVGDSTVEKDEEYKYCKYFRNTFFARGNAMREPNKQGPQTKWQHTPNEKDLGRLTKEGNYEEDDKTSKRVQCH